jgi:hypothetical protein
MSELASPARLWPAFAREGVKPLVLRDFEQLPEIISGGDLDLALESAAQLSAAERAIRLFAAESGLRIVSLLRHSYVWEFKLRSDSPPRQLIVDLHTDGEGWRGPLYLSNEELFAAACDRGPWWEPAPHHQAMMAVFQHLLWGRFYKEKYHALVPCWIAGHEQAFRACVARAFGPDLAPRLVEMILAADAQGLAAMVPRLRRRLWQLRGMPDLAGSLERLAAFVAGEIRLTLARSGRWVVLVGPDGVGKTTVAGLLAAETKDFFRGVRYHHWIPRWQEPLSAAVPTGGARPPLRGDAHGLAATFLSALRLVRNVVRAHLAYRLRILPHLLRQRLVIGDRYLFNYVLDPRSVRYHGPNWLVRWALHLAPQPDLVLCLEAPPAEIHRRKPELSLEEIQHIITRCRELPAHGFRTAAISAEMPVASVVQAAAWEVICTLSRSQNTHRPKPQR